MGLEIWITGSKLLARRQTNLTRRMNRAEKLCGQLDKRTARYKTMDTLRSNIFKLLCSGKMGYIRSNYNEAGLFILLEKVFGVDPVSLLFSSKGDSSGAHPLNPKQFLSKLRALEDTAKTLKDGDKLPVLRRVRLKLRHLPPRNPKRQAGEEACRKAVRFFCKGGTSSGQLVPIRPRRFSRKKYGPLLAWGLKELRDFGELGAEIWKAGERPCYFVDS